MAKEKNALEEFEHQYFQIILESLPHPFYVLDASNYSIIIANQAARSVGVSTASTCHALTHGRDTPCDDDEKHPCPLKQVKKTKKPYVVEHIHRDQHGSPIHAEVHGYPIFDEHGNVIQMIEYSLNITDRKTAELELRNYKGHLEELVDERTSELQKTNDALSHEVKMRKITEKVLQKSYQTIKNQQNQMLFELDQARETQKTLLPDKLDHIPKAHAACQYIPMQQIGGDFYDIFELKDDKFGVMVADVTGHGVSAALISFMVSAIFADAAQRSLSPQKTMERTNKHLEGRLPRSKYATIFYGIYDAKQHTLTYTTAAHPPGLLVRPATNEIFYFKGKGSVVGMLPNELACYDEQTFQLFPGDKLVLHTDGIIELKDENDKMWGTNQLAEFLKKNRHLPIDKLLESICEFGKVYSHCDTFNDDITMVGLEFNP
ncbi:MAG: SpoIIE family protein phosphatase [SAR324 cluster bacterium]|nr:SpoIIE family protein phosphatase [SAR324 cluster bacterium]